MVSPEVHKLEDSRLTVDSVEKVRNLAVRIGGHHGLSPADALASFEKDAIDNYDVILGLRPKVEVLKHEMERLQVEIKTEKAKLDETKEACGKLGEAFRSYESLRSKRIDDRMIMGLDRILSETGLQVEFVEGELKAVGSLAGVVEVRQVQVTTLDGKIEELNREYESDKKADEEELRNIRKEVEEKKDEFQSVVKAIAEALGVKADLKQIEDAKRLEAAKFKAFKLELRKAKSEERRKKREELKAYVAGQRVKIREGLRKKREEVHTVAAEVRRLTAQRRAIEKQVKKVGRERDTITGERDGAYDAIQKIDERLKQVTPLTTIATVLDNPANPVNLEMLYRASLAIFHALEISLVVLSIPRFRTFIEMDLKRLTKELEKQARELEIRARNATRHDQ